MNVIRLPALLAAIALISPTASADISSDIATANSRLSSAQSTGSRLSSTLSSVRSNISRVRSEINSARSKESIARSEASTFNSNATTYNAEAARYRIEASLFRSEHDSQIARKAQLSVQLGDLIDKNYKLENEISAEKVKKQALQDLYSDIHYIASAAISISEGFSNVADSNEGALLGHEAWLNAFHTKTQEFKPLFNDIYSADSYKEEMDKVYRFSENIPAGTSVKSDEDATHLLVDRLINEIKGLLSFTKKELPTQAGIGYLELSNKGEILSELILLDESMSSLLTEITGIKSSLYKREYKRTYTVDFTIVAWSRLAEESLRSVNIVEATSIINAAASSYNDSIAYSMVRADLLSSQSKYRTDYRTYYSPLHARRGANATLQKATNLQGSLSSLAISMSTQNEINAYILDHISSVNRDLVDINEDLEDRNYHHQRRISFTQGMLSRYESRMTSTCVDLANDIIAAEIVSSSHEKNFIKFKGGCLR